MRKRFLTGVTTSKTSNVFAKSLYDYDTLDRRTRQERADGSYWNYLYDGKSQLTSAKRKWQDGSFVAGQQYEFEWDSIGNRTRTRQGGDPSGGDLRGRNLRIQCAQPISPERSSRQSGLDRDGGNGSDR